MYSKRGHMMTEVEAAIEILGSTLIDEQFDCIYNVLKEACPDSELFEKYKVMYLGVKNREVKLKAAYQDEQ